MKTVGKDYKSRAYSLLTSVHDFAEFTCTGKLFQKVLQAQQMLMLTNNLAYKPGSNYDSVEVWHNFVHSTNPERTILPAIC